MRFSFNSNIYYIVQDHSEIRWQFVLQNSLLLLLLCTQPQVFGFFFKQIKSCNNHTACLLCAFISPPLWRNGGGCQKPQVSCLLHQFESMFSFWALTSDICCENVSILKSWDWWKCGKQCQTRVYLKSSSNRQHFQCSTTSFFTRNNTGTPGECIEMLHNRHPFVLLRGTSASGEWPQWRGDRCSSTPAPTEWNGHGGPCVSRSLIIRVLIQNSP